MHTHHLIVSLIAAVTAVASCTHHAATDSLVMFPSPICLEDYFLDKSMRLDFYHCGNSQTECYFFDELKEEPYYAGSHVALRDSFNYGNQRFVLLDKESGREIYSFHYCTLWNEWSVTPEAEATSLGMPESVVFPYPKHVVVAQIWSRNPATKNQWQLKYEQEIDPSSYFVKGFSPIYETQDLHVVGPSNHCLDIVLIPEGYAEADKEQFLKDCELFVNDFFRFEPWTSNEQRVNMRMVWAPSVESGVSIPAEHKWVNTTLNAHYYTFDSERYQMTYDFQAVRDIAGHVPYDYVYILSNSDKYGGGGIYNFYGMGAGHNNRGNSGEVHVHEFGHQLLGLGDEYVEIGNSTSDLYALDVEPWEVNLTTRTDISGKPWADGTLADDPIHGKAFPEGGGYLEHGIWRPYENCLMNTLDYGFCPICLQAITDYLNYITR